MEVCRSIDETQDGSPMAWGCLSAMVAVEVSAEGGRPAISPDMQALIRRLSRENILWSAETIHGQLLLLGFDPPCPDTIRKYMVRPKGGTGKSQSWLTVLRNHLQVSWAMAFFTVPTLRFQILYVFVVLNRTDGVGNP